MDLSEKNYLESRKAARGENSPVEQAEPLDVVNVSEDAPEEVVETETEELESNEPLEANELSEAEELFYELDGEEVSQSQLKEWKNNGLMQSDYTRKTQELADSKKSVETKQAKLNDTLTQLEAIIAEETPSAETLADWREYEPEMLLNYQDKMSKRKELLGQANEFKPAPKQHDYSALLDNNPTWMDNGKTTEAYKNDMQKMTDYATSRGMSVEEASTLSPVHLQIILDATRGQELLKKGKNIAKQVRKAPASTKPKAQAQSTAQSQLKEAQKRYAKTGSDKDYLAIRKLRRQINN